MAALALFSILLSAMVAIGLRGHHALRRAEGALARRPAVGILVWMALLITWTLAALSLGPILAWNLSGSFLPGRAGAMCHACVHGANPLGTWTTPVDVLPPFFALFVPLLIGIWFTAALAVAVIGASLRARRHVDVLSTAGLRSDLGDHVWLIPDEAVTVYSTPVRGGAIVLSQGAQRALDHRMLAAVLAHEQAHLDRRHHWVTGVLRVFSALVGWLPLVDHGVRAVTVFLEMDADDCARRITGDAALFDALMSLAGMQQPAPATRAGGPLSAATRAVGQRLKRLLSAAEGSAEASGPGNGEHALLAPAMLVILQLGVLLLATMPYVHIVASGCLRS